MSEGRSGVEGGEGVGGGRQLTVIVSDSAFGDSLLVVSSAVQTSHSAVIAIHSAVPTSHSAVIAIHSAVLTSSRAF